MTKTSGFNYAANQFVRVSENKLASAFAANAIPLRYSLLCGSIQRGGAWA